MDRVSDVETVEFFRSSADNLENNSNAAVFTVVVSDSKGDTFALAVCSEDNELTRFSLSGNTGSVNFHKCHIGIQNLFLKNLEHCHTFFLVIFLFQADVFMFSDIYFLTSTSLTKRFFPSFFGVSAGASDLLSSAADSSSAGVFSSGTIFGASSLLTSLQGFPEA